VAYKNAFTKYAETVGGDIAVPTKNTLEGIRQAAERLENRGQTTGGLYQRLRTILKKSPESFTPGEFDELYGSIIKQAFNARGAAGGEGKIVLAAITQDMDDFGRQFGASFGDDIAKASALREQFRELRKIPQLERLAGELGDTRAGGTKGTIDWMNSLFSKDNGKALAKLRELNPQLYHDLADAWLAKQIDNSVSSNGLLRQVDGGKLLSWVEQNQAKLKEIYGTKQYTALRNFSQYASLMSGAQKRAASSADPNAVLGLVARAGGELTGAKFGGLPLLVPGEAASFVLARGLSDPSSQLFKVFTQGFSPGTRSFMVKSGELAGQSAARNGKDQR
jgi:hypothetical protein